METCCQTISACVRTMSAKGMKTGLSELRVIVQPLITSHIFLEQIIQSLGHSYSSPRKQGIPWELSKVQIFRFLSECISYLLCITNNSET